MRYIAFDVHKRYTWVRVEGPDGVPVRERRWPTVEGFCGSSWRSRAGQPASGGDGGELVLGNG
jgi:hypothetical protein